MRTITVLGEGAFGSAIAQLLADNGHQVTLWCHDPAIAQEITTRRTNTKYLPGVVNGTASPVQTTVHPNIQPTTDLAAAAKNDLIVAAVPVKFLRGMLQQLKPFITTQHRWVLVCKGIEEGTCSLPTGIVSDVLGNQRVAYLAGPSFAHEIVEKQLTAVVLAGDRKILPKLKAVFENSYFKIHLSEDLPGVQLCAALKNVFAIGMGLIDGLTGSDNTRAFFLTQALDEMVTILYRHGDKKITAYGLAGVGDLILSSLSVRGRNMQAGRLLGMGVSLQEAEQRFGVLPEGFNTLKSIPDICTAVDAPLLHTIYDVVYKGAPAKVLTEVLTKM